MVDVEVLENGAVYVDDTRITDRSTKPWGGGIRSVEHFECEDDQVVAELSRRGHRISIRKIDEARYMEQRKAMLDVPDPE